VADKPDLGWELVSGRALALRSRRDVAYEAHDYERRDIR
jgi:hypothetical protein